MRAGAGKPAIDTMTSPREIVQGAFWRFGRRPNTEIVQFGKRRHVETLARVHQLADRVAGGKVKQQALRR